MERRILAAALVAAVCVISCGDRITNTTTTVVTGETYRVFGKVVDRTLAGAGNIGVVISGVGVCDTTTSDAHGFYAFSGIPSGFYVVGVDTASASAHSYAVPDTVEQIAVLAEDEQVPDLIVWGPSVKNLLRISILDGNGAPFPKSSAGTHYVYVYLDSPNEIHPVSTGTGSYVYSYTIPLDAAALIPLSIYMGTSTNAVGSVDVEVFAVSGTRVSTRNIDLSSKSVAFTVDTPSLAHDIRTK